MQIATWNVNSIRTRHERVLAFLERHNIDAIAMQETKCKDFQFPMDAFTAAGYEVAHHGLNQWNGVAIASRVGISDVQIGFDNMPGFGEPPAAEARAIAATVGEGESAVRLWSLYVPNGREIDHAHYRYKLEWLEQLRRNGEEWLRENPQAQIALTGDWNIAPQDDDVWDMGFFEGKTHVTPPERAAFTAMVDTGFADVVRPFTPGPGTYTYWDYTQLRFPKKQGMRIDFALCSPALASRVSDAFIDRDERKGKGASDHAPVVIELT